MNKKTVRLKKGKEESLRRFHPWVFSGAIASLSEPIEEGEIVRVCNNSSDFIAIGHFQLGSIAVRILSFEDIEIDEEFWRRKLSIALKMRNSIGIADTANNSYVEKDIKRLSR